MSDLTVKRQNIAKNAVIACNQLLNALNLLTDLQVQRSYLDQDFQANDFLNEALNHLSPGILGTLFDFVVPSLNTAVTDQGNSGRNKQILYQVAK